MCVCVCETAGKQASLFLRLTDRRTEEERRQNSKIQRNKYWARYRRFLSQLEIINTYRLDREIRGNQTTEDERWESHAVRKHIGQSSAAFIAGMEGHLRRLYDQTAVIQHFDLILFCQSGTQGIWNISACVCISDRTCLFTTTTSGHAGGGPTYTLHSERSWKLSKLFASHQNPPINISVSPKL